MSLRKLAQFLSCFQTGEISHDRHVPICRCQKTNVSTVQEVVISLTSDKAFFLGARERRGGGEAKRKKFFNCVITMHQQILFKYSLRHRYFGN